MKSKYIYFIEIETEKKTKEFLIMNSSKEIQIGVIKWYSPWRQYCFFPENETIFNIDCLKNIEYFIKDLMIERKKI